MPERLTTEARSANMSRVKGRDTKPELVVRKMLHGLGYRFRLHRKDLPGRPDVVLPKHKKVIFVNGCFWHGHDNCPRAKRPANNREFWNEKINGNMERDAAAQAALKEQGWQVLVLWQCRMKDQSALLQTLKEFLEEETPVEPKAAQPFDAE